MKTFVLCTLIAVATSGNAQSSPAEPVAKEQRVDAFKSQLVFHQRNVEFLWNQYDQAVARIQDSQGNHAQLERDRAFFVGAYQQDISQGIRVEESEKAIAHIEVRYKQAHAQRDAFEGRQIARLLGQLETELKREDRRFKKVKQKNAALIDAETLPLLQEVERYLAQSIARASEMASRQNGQTMAAR